MFIAQKKRHENIAEYILYLWQLEDLLRALRFDTKAIFDTLVAPHDLNPQQKQTLLGWYVESGGLLKQEGKENSGHMTHTLHLIGSLQQLHQQLMSLPVGEEYKKMFEKLAEELPRLRIVIAKDGISDIELCFRALYGVMLYRIKGDESKREVSEDVVATISPVIGKLAEIFHRVEQGTLDLFGNND